MKKGYDKQKAHEYYMKHRKLKGKKVKVKSAGKVSDRKKKKKVRQIMPKVASTATKNSGGKAMTVTLSKYDEISAKLGKIKDKVKKLSPKKKKALKKALSKLKKG